MRWYNQGPGEFMKKIKYKNQSTIHTDIFDCYNKCVYLYNKAYKLEKDTSQIKLLNKLSALFYDLKCNIELNNKFASYVHKRNDIVTLTKFILENELFIKKQIDRQPVNNDGLLEKLNRRHIIKNEESLITYLSILHTYCMDLSSSIYWNWCYSSLDKNVDVFDI